MLLYYTIKNVDDEKFDIREHKTLECAYAEFDEVPNVLSYISTNFSNGFEIYSFHSKHGSFCSIVKTVNPVRALYLAREDYKEKI